MSSAPSYVPEVYLRVCGGIFIVQAVALAIEGLSPRVRRHLVGAGVGLFAARSISACAEASQPDPVRRAVAEVYLRVCGGISIGV